MTDFLRIGLSGLDAFRRALDVTSHNVANVATEGYSRQRAEFASRPAQPYGNGWVGSGVGVDTIRRSHDDFLVAQSRGSASMLERLGLFADLAGRVDDLFADSESGLSAALQQFTNAVQGVASAPTSLAARQVLLGEAGALTDRLRHFDARLRALDQDVNTRLRGEAQEISGLARSIAQLNGEITSGIARTGQPPNDLLDERDRLLDELAGHVNVQVVPQDGGALNVFVGSGQPLVLGDAATSLEATSDPFDPQRMVLALRSGGGPVDVTGLLTGGSLGGAVDFRRDVLDPARNALGRVAVAVASAVNEQHRAGMDLTGSLGGDLFAVGATAVLPASGNAGNATLAVAHDDPGALTTADYELQFTAGGWSLRRLDSGANVALVGAGTVADPLRAEGLGIVVSGAAQVGDRFLLRPTREAVSGLRVLVSDAARVAAAAPIRTAAAATNTGGAGISAGEVLDAADPQLLAPVTIEFTAPNTYSVNGVGSFAWASGTPIDLNGWRVEIAGTPAVGDRFTVTHNETGAGDNRNALRLAETMRRPLLDGGTTSVDGAVGRLLGDIGVVTRRAQLDRDAEQIVQEQMLAEREAVSGVNLDEEAANMMRYQQAYQAAAQLIQVANMLFDSLLAATRR